MSLRLKLLLVALSTLALPWAGWQFVRQTETLLREGQEQALLASAGVLAKVLDARRIESATDSAALYIHRARDAIVVDGFADDWILWRPFAQALGPAREVQKLRVTLVRRNDDLYLLAEVRDATRTRVDPADSRARVSDHVTLVLERGGETRRYLLSSAAPGTFDAPARGSGEGLPDHLAGMLQEDGSGYRIELRFPRALAPDRIGARCLRCRAARCGYARAASSDRLRRRRRRCACAAGAGPCACACRQRRRLVDRRRRPSRRRAIRPARPRSAGSPI